MKTIFPDRIEEKIKTGSYIVEERSDKQKILESIFRKIEETKKSNKRIVLPESEDLRVLKAAEIIIKHKIARITLLGDRDKIVKNAEKNGIDLSGADFVICGQKEEYVNLLHELRKHKGIKKKEATEIMQDPIYYGMVMVKTGDADGMVAGAATSSDKVIRAALQIIKPREGLDTVSGAFLVFIPNNIYGERFSKRGVFVFADCAVNKEPDYKQLADIAQESAETIRMFDIEPRIAMLSYITSKSLDMNLCTTKMCKAGAFLKGVKPDLDVEELQLDAAIDQNVARLKNPKTRIGGNANILIFPDLQSGNIGYKLVERFGNAEAIGPILQGLQRPVNDLSRGCSIEDIVNLVTITAYQACCMQDR